MHFHFYTHHVADPDVVREMERLNLNLERFMSDIDEFIAATLAKISAQKTQIDGVVQLLSSVKHQLADALQGESLSSGAKAKLAAIMPALEANTGEISDAITANTDVPVMAVPPTAPVADLTPSPDMNAAATPQTSDPAPAPAPSDGAIPAG